jgi:hypothetical protein
MNIDLDFTEATQIEAALLDRLNKANEAVPVMTPGTIEADMVDAEVRYTGAALTKIQLLLYGEDEPQEPAWDLLKERAAHDGHETFDAHCALCVIEMDNSYRSVVGWVR